MSLCQILKNFQFLILGYPFYMDVRTCCCIVCKNITEEREQRAVKQFSLTHSKYKYNSHVVFYCSFIQKSIFILFKSYCCSFLSEKTTTLSCLYLKELRWDFLSFFCFCVKIYCFLKQPKLYNFVFCFAKCQMK